MPTTPRTMVLGRLAALVGVLAAFLLLAAGGRVAAAGDEPPRDVVAFPNAPGAITITWSHSGDGVYYFVIEQEAASPFAVATPDRDKRAYTITGLTPNTTYGYRVCAVFDFNRVCSDEDGVGYASVRTLPPEAPQGSERPPAPRIVSRETGDTWVRICWQGDDRYDFYLVDYEEKGIRNTVPPIKYESGDSQGCQHVGGLLPGRTYIFIVQGCTETLLGIGDDKCWDWSAGYEASTLGRVGDEFRSRWQLLDDNPAASQVVAAGGNLYQRHDTGAIWKYTGTPKAWQLLDDNPATVTIVADGGELYQLHHGGHIWKYTGTPKAWQLLDDNPATVALVAAGGNLYQLHNTGAVWKYTGTPKAWQLLDDNPATNVLAASGSNLYQLHRGGQIWKYTGTPKAWQLLDDNPATVALAADGGELYQLHTSGLVWKYTGTPKAWQLLDDNPAARQLAASGGNLYQRHDSGHIWKYTGTPKVWQPLDDNGATASITADGSNLYQLHTSGLIWKYTR